MRPVIVVFGAAIRADGKPSGAMCHRVAAALETGRSLARPIYMPTGGQGRFGRPEADVMAELLEGGGAPADAIVIERTGRNTIRSVQACARLLGPTRAPVYAATSGYHMIRCVLLLRLAGLRAWPARLPPIPASARWQKRWFWRLREIPAVPIDGALMIVGRATGRLRVR